MLKSVFLNYLNPLYKLYKTLYKLINFFKVLFSCINGRFIRLFSDHYFLVRGEVETMGNEENPPA